MIRPALAGLVLLGAAQAPSPAPDPRAKDGVDIFVAFCLSHPLDPANAHAQLDGHPEIARPLGKDALAATDQPGWTASEGWLINSPHRAEMRLTFVPAKRTCALTIHTADAAQTRAAFEAAVGSFFGAMGKTPEARPETVETVDAVAIHRIGSELTLGEHKIALIGSFGDAPVRGKQHLLTFTLEY